jgi:hypothetical protein
MVAKQISEGFSGCLLRAYMAVRIENRPGIDLGKQFLDQVRTHGSAPQIADWMAENVNQLAIFNSLTITELLFRSQRGMRVGSAGGTACFLISNHSRGVVMGAKRLMWAVIFLLGWGLAATGGFYFGNQNTDSVIDLESELALGPSVDQSALQAELQRVKDDLLSTRTELDRALRDRTRLEGQLADADSMPAGEEAPQGPPMPARRNRDNADQQAGNNNPRGGMDFAARMEEMRQNDPERFQEIQDRIDQARTSYQDMRNRQYASLDQRIQGARTQEEVDVYESIKSRLQNIDAIAAQMQDPNADFDRREAFEQMRTAQNELRELSEMDRDYQLMNLAQRMGAKNLQEAEALANKIEEIYQDADSYTSFRGMMGGGGGGGGMPMMGGGRGGRGGR